MSNEAKEEGMQEEETEAIMTGASSQPNNGYQDWLTNQSEEFRSWLTDQQSRQTGEYQSWKARVRKYPFYLKDAPEHIKRDKQIVLAAVGKDGEALKFASPDLQIDEDILSTAINKGGGIGNVETILNNLYQNDGRPITQYSKLIGLRVFQSSPLASEKFDDKGKHHQVPQNVLDFGDEEKALKEALRDAQGRNPQGIGMRLQFEVATDESLGKFISGGGKMIHFSGHGAPDCLLLENSYGGAQKLLVDPDLKDWIQAAGENHIQFAFIAACNSANAGYIFKEAGVPHVIGTSDSICHKAAAVFAEVFYHNFATGMTIFRAFRLAQNGLAQKKEIANCEEEAKKFVLLPEWGNHDIKLSDIASLPGPSYGEISNKTPSSGQASSTPSPPQNFVGRELEMYKTLESLNRRGEQLVIITGERGVGKKSFGMAIGHYMTKRRSIWGEVYWIHGDGKDSNNSLLSQVILKLSSTDSEETAEKAVVIIDATKILEENLAELQSSVLDLLRKKNKTKLLLIQQKEVPIAPAAEHSSYAHIELKNLDLEPALLLFGSWCKHVRKSPNSWSHDRMHKRCGQFPKMAITILGSGNPKKIIQLAAAMDEPHYNKFIGQQAVDDFRQVVHHLYPLRREQQGVKEQCVEELARATKDNAPNPKPEFKLVKRWKETETEFSPILRRYGQVYYKKAPSYIRRAEKGEKVKTIKKGKLVSVNEVPDGNCRVVCSITGEEYILTEAEFEDGYDVKHPKDLSQSTDEHLQKLHQNGYLEYQSIRKVRAIELGVADMNWFRHGINSSSGSVYEPPWGGTDRISTGDYLVMRHEENKGINDGVYIIERGDFKKTYCNPEMEAGESGDTHGDGGARDRPASDLQMAPDGSAANGSDEVSSRISRMEQQNHGMEQQIHQIHNALKRILEIQLAQSQVTSNKRNKADTVACDQQQT